MPTLDRWLVPVQRPVVPTSSSSLVGGAQQQQQQQQSRRPVLPLGGSRRLAHRAPLGPARYRDSGCFVAETILNDPVPPVPTLVSSLPDGAYGAGKSLFFLDHSLVALVASRGLIAYCLDPVDYCPRTVPTNASAPHGLDDDAVAPSLAVRWPERIIAAAPLTAAVTSSSDATPGGGASLALGLAQGLHAVDLEAVDEGQPASHASVAIDASLLGSPSAIATHQQAVAAVTRLGGVLLWDTRVRRLAAQWSTRLERHATVLGATALGSCEEFTSAVYTTPTSVAVGTAAGRLHQFDLRCGASRTIVPSAPVIDVADAVSAALGGKSTVSVIPCLRRHRSIPNILYFNTIAGFCGMLDLTFDHDRNATCAGGGHGVSVTPVVAGVFAADDATESRFGVSPTGPLVACPRASTASLRLVALQPFVSGAFAGTRGRSAYASGFPSPVVDAAFHPHGEASGGGIWALTRDVQLYRVDPGQASSTSAPGCHDTHNANA